LLRRPFLAFMILVVVPCAAAMLLTGRAAEEAAAALRRSADALVARMVLATVEADLDLLAQDLATGALPYPEPDPDLPAVRRALAGDTAVAAYWGAEGAELEVVFADGAESAPAEVTILRSIGRLEPHSASQVARATGYRAAVYLDGRLWGDAPSLEAPPALDEASLAAGSGPEGTILPVSPAGVLLSRPSQAGESTRLAALVSPGRAAPPAVEFRVAVVLGLLILFSTLAAWIQLAAPQGRPRRQAWTVVALALVPALTSAQFLVHISRGFEATATQALARDLTRGLAVARVRHSASSMADLRELTGFHATLVQRGGIEETTFESNPMEIEDLPSPPRGFTTSGAVETPEGPSLYVAVRTEPDIVLVATAPLPTARIASLGRHCLEIGAGLFVWLLLVGTVASKQSASASALDARGHPEEKPAEVP
jgi:hypothetical protein